MKRVLILTDQYPPYFAPRIAAVAKYLPRYGWQPIVATGIAKNTSSQIHYTQQANREEDPCTVLRIPLDKHGTQLGHYSAFLLELLFEWRDRRFGRELRPYLSDIPKPDAVLVFAYRKFPIRSGYRLAKKWDVPLLVDCRDIVEQYPPGDFLPTHIKIAGRTQWRLMEKIRQRIAKTRNRYLSTAAAVTTVSPWHRDFLANVNRHVHLIYNGYDPNIFRPTHPIADRFRIVYTGRLMTLAARDPSPLFAALSGERLSGLVSSGEIVVDWWTDDYSRDLIKPLALKYALEHIMNYHQMVPLAELPPILSQASILLMLSAPEKESGTKSWVSTKIFEAMAMQKPILVALSDEAILAELCRDAGLGCLAQTQADIEDYILKQYALWKQHGFTQELPQSPDLVARFDRSIQVADFARLLDETTRLR